MEAVKPDASDGDRMTPLMTISTALYVCEGCDDAGNEGNCYHADHLRHAPTHQWLCETCYDDAKAEDDSSEGWPAWDELVRHPCMAAELIEARLAIAHMHDMIALHVRQREEPQLPAEIRAALLDRGKVHWGATAAKPDAEHVENFATTLQLTRAHFGTEGDQQLDGVYLQGTDIVICHTGTSPNSPIHARAITGAWNYLYDLAAYEHASLDAGILSALEGAE